MSRRAFAIAAILLVSILLIAGVGALLHYRSYRDTPQYSLAMLVDAAKRDDGAEIDRLVDINAVVDDFVPQVTDKAIELYGRGQPPQVIAMAQRLAVPILPAIKDRSRAELPRLIRDRTERFGYIPFFAMVLGAERYLDIRASGDTAIVRSKLREYPLEVTMRKRGERWQIVGIREEQLATDIARAIGQEIMAVASSGNPRNAVERLGLGNLSELLRQAEQLVR